MSAPVHDAVVLGGGLVGTALALALSRHGLSTALLEPVPAETRGAKGFDGRAYAIAPGSANLLRVLGVWQRVEAGAEPVRDIFVEDRTGGPVAPAWLHFDPAEAGQPVLGWIVEDHALRTALMDAVAEAEGLVQPAPARALAVRDEGGAAEVETEAGGGLRARLVIACDGRRSAIARAAGIEYLAWGYGQTGLVSAISHERPHEGLAHQSFFPGGPFAVLPLRGNRSALVWSEKDAVARRVAALPDEGYLAEIAARIGPRLGALALEGKRWSYPLGLALALDYARPRLAVVGDAAHGVHPIAGQGLNMGLRDVAALTEVLVEAARRGEDIGAGDVLGRYERWRRPEATAFALGMDGLNRLFSSTAGTAQAVRNAGLGLVARFGPARRFFMEAAAGTAPQAPRLMRGRAI